MEWGKGNAGLGWRFLLGALTCMGVSLLQSERGVGGIVCGGVYMYS